MTTFSFSEAADYVKYVVDDTGNGRRLGADLHAIVRHTNVDYHYQSRLIGWIPPSGEPFFVAVHSYLDVELTDDDATKLAMDWLTEQHEAYLLARHPDVIL